MLTPYASGNLQLDSIHCMYWERTGKSNGQTVVLVHGGPGAGMDSSNYSLFDTLHYDIVAYDQRGAGRSTPSGEIIKNTTGQLVADLESLRQHLSIESWLVSGGSWGCALAIAYTQAHPDRVSGLILRGIFLCQPSEIDWYFNGIRNIYPEAWRQFIEYLPVDDRDHPAKAYHRHVLDPDPAVHLPAAEQWCLYEARCATLLPDPHPVSEGYTRHWHSLARIQTHYFKNRFFINGRTLLNDIDLIKHIPAELVQGRHDAICPPISAYRLHQAWPKARLRMVANAGHAASEPGIRRALLAASESLKNMGTASPRVSAKRIGAH